MQTDGTRSPRRAVPVAQVPPLEFVDEMVTEVADGSALSAAEQLAVLNALRTVQAHELDPISCRRALVESAAGVLQADLGWLSLVDPSGTGFPVVHSFGLGDRIDIDMQSLSGLGAEAARRRATLIINDFTRSTRTPAHSRQQLIAAGVRSLIFAPLIAGELIGLLCIGRRGAHGFERRDSLLLGTLAAQGATTIYNGSIFTEVEEQTHVLRAALSVGAEVHDRLLAGDGLAGAAQALAVALRRGVLIHQSAVAEEPGWYAPDGHQLSRSPDSDTVRSELVAAGEVLGTIEIDGGEPLTALQGQTVEVASTAIISELIARRESEEAEWRLHGELLAELVSVPAPVPRSLAIRAGRHGVDLSTAATVVVIARIHPRTGATSLLLDTRAALRSRLPARAAVLAFDRGDSVVLALPAKTADAAVVKKIVEALEPGGRVRAGVGRAPDHHEALRQADACLLLGGASTRPAVLDVDDLGLFRAVLEASPPRHLGESVRRTLGRVHAADTAKRIPLMQTLEAFCAAEGRIEVAARLCNIHESTFRYRLDKLDELIDLRDGPVRLLRVRAAIQTLNVLRAAGHDPFPDGQSAASPAPTKL